MSNETNQAYTLVKQLIGNAAVESFGIRHQVLFIDFRNDTPEDISLSLDTDVYSNIALPNGLSKIEEALLIFSKINLCCITNIELDDKSNLTLFFENDVSVKFSGTPENLASEPWELASSTPVKEGGHVLIATHSGGYITWGGEE